MKTIKDEYQLGGWLEGGEKGRGEGGRPRIAAGSLFLICGGGDRVLSERVRAS